MKRLLLLALLALPSFAAPASAQRYKWWQDQRFQKELGLTSEQSERLEEIFQKHQPTLRERMQALDRAEKTFDELVESGDDTAVLGQVDVVEAARAELSKTRTLMLLRMRRSLTADQWAKFTALAQSVRDSRQRTPNREQAAPSRFAPRSHARPARRIVWLVRLQLRAQLQVSGSWLHYEPRAAANAAANEKNRRHPSFLPMELRQLATRASYRRARWMAPKFFGCPAFRAPLPS